MTGIYQITLNDKIYIGQSKDIYSRKKSHLYKFKNNTHPNNILQNAYNKYGEDKFEFKVLEECSIEELNNKELFWINKLNAHYSNGGYNIKGGGDSIHTLSEETKQKLSKSLLSFYKTKKGLIVKQKLSQINSNKNNNWYGKKHSQETLEKIINAKKGNTNMLGKKHSEETKRKISESKKGKPSINKKKIICIETNIVYDSITQAGRELKLNIGHISSVCNGKRKSTGGYKFKYIN